MPAAAGQEAKRARSAEVAHQVEGPRLAVGNDEGERAEQPRRAIRPEALPAIVDELGVRGVPGWPAKQPRQLVAVGQPGACGDPEARSDEQCRRLTGRPERGPAEIGDRRIAAVEALGSQCRRALRRGSGKSGKCDNDGQLAKTRSAGLNAQAPAIIVDDRVPGNLGYDPLGPVVAPSSPRPG